VLTAGLEHRPPVEVRDGWIQRRDEGGGVRDGGRDVEEETMELEVE
jgi:hypothetical protein